MKWKSSSKPQTRQGQSVAVLQGCILEDYGEPTGLAASFPKKKDEENFSTDGRVQSFHSHDFLC